MTSGLRKSGRGSGSSRRPADFIGRTRPTAGRLKYKALRCDIQKGKQLLASRLAPPTAFRTDPPIGKERNIREKWNGRRRVRLPLPSLCEFTSKDTAASSETIALVILIAGLTLLGRMRCHLS